MDGWIKLHRKLLSSRVWNTADAEGKVILITLLLRASHAATQWRITASKTASLNPGQLFITYRTFAAKCGVSTKKITTELQRLESLGFISTKKGREGTIITVCNWAYYQQAETHLDTAPETPMETPAKPVPASDSPLNTAPVETPMETQKGTGLETHNKIYILIKNKYNKTDLNNKLLDQAELHPEGYCCTFGSKLGISCSVRAEGSEHGEVYQESTQISLGHSAELAAKWHAKR